MYSNSTGLSMLIYFYPQEIEFANGAVALPHQPTVAVIPYHTLKTKDYSSSQKITDHRLKNRQTDLKHVANETNDQNNNYRGENNIRKILASYIKYNDVELLRAIGTHSLR